MALLQGKRLEMKMTKEGKFGQEVAHLLGRDNLMKSIIVLDEYDVRKPDLLLSTVYPLTKFPGISLFGPWCGISISTCQMQNKYLHRLQSKFPRPTSEQQVVHRYGPVNLFDTEQRVLAVSMIYRLMLSRAATILEHKKA